MDIYNLMYNAGAPSYYQSNIRNVFDDHMTFLRNHPNNDLLTVPPKDVERFQGDLYGLFLALGIPPQYHHIVRQMNELPSPFRIPPELSQLVIPDYKVVDAIRQASTATNRVR